MLRRISNPSWRRSCRSTNSQLVSLSLATGVAVTAAATVAAVSAVCLSGCGIRFRNNSLFPFVSTAIDKAEEGGASVSSKGDGAIAAKAAVATADSAEDVRLAKAQLLLGGAFLPVLTGVKGRRLAKKARKVMQLQQQLEQQQREQQVQETHKRKETKKQKQQQQIQKEASPENEVKADASDGDGVACQQQEHQKQRQQQKEPQGQVVRANGLIQQAGSETAFAAPNSNGGGSSSKASSAVLVALKTKRSSASAAAAKAGKCRLPRITYGPDIAAALLHRQPEMETVRKSLPAAEAEPRVLSFLLQQQHPSSREAEDDCGTSSSSDEDTRQQHQQLGSKVKKRRTLDLSKCRQADVLCVAGATGSGKSTQARANPAAVGAAANQLLCECVFVYECACWPLNADPSICF